MTKPRQALDDPGAKWVDKEVIIDGNLIPSRKPDDIPFFNEAIMNVLKQTKK